MLIYMYVCTRGRFTKPLRTHSRPESAKLHPQKKAEPQQGFCSDSKGSPVAFRDGFITKKKENRFEF